LYLCEALDVVLVIYLCGPHHLHGLVPGCEILVLKAPSDYRSDHLLPLYEVLPSDDEPSSSLKTGVGSHHFSVGSAAIGSYEEERVIWTFHNYIKTTLSTFI
jgi:hypothetical protein